jgi:hypothetical protein
VKADAGRLTQVCIKIAIEKNILSNIISPRFSTVFSLSALETVAERFAKDETRSGLGIKG